MSALKIIVNCGPSGLHPKCVESLLAQDVHEWEAFVTLDGIRSKSLNDAVVITRDLRFSVCGSSQRMYSLFNQIRAIKESGSDPEDIIVALDGDDWFARPDALRIILDAYEQTGCWMTYGSWVSTHPGPAGEMWPAYPADTTDFRSHVSNTGPTDHRWLATAVRTWKRWLWQLVKDEDLRDANGEYFRIAEDRAIMLPMLEMSGTQHARHIPEPIMVYDEIPANYTPAQQAESVANVKLIHSRAPYPRLEPHIRAAAPRHDYEPLRRMDSAQAGVAYQGPQPQALSAGSSCTAPTESVSPQGLKA